MLPEEASALLPVPGCQNIQKVDKLVAGTWVTRVCAVE